MKKFSRLRDKNDKTKGYTYIPSVRNDDDLFDKYMRIKTKNYTSGEYLFKNSTLTSVDEFLKEDDTKNFTSMNEMFYGCSNLQSIPQLNTSNVTDMFNMFYYCKNLQSIPQLDTSNATSMVQMFNGCSNLQSIPQLDTSNATDMYYMFGYCGNLKTIDITSLDKISSTDDINYFARYCYSLTKLIIRNMSIIPPLGTNSFSSCYHFDGTKNSTYNPNGLKDGRIYVPDNMVDSLKSSTNWSTYADIIVPLSTLEE